jgi:hypothetical protein
LPKDFLFFFEMNNIIKPQLKAQGVPREGESNTTNIKTQGRQQNRTTHSLKEKQTTRSSLAGTGKQQNTKQHRTAAKNKQPAATKNAEKHTPTQVKQTATPN